MHPALLINGVSMILGNDFAGSVVWSNRPPSPVVASKPMSVRDWIKVVC